MATPTPPTGPPENDKRPKAPAQKTPGAKATPAKKAAPAEKATPPEKTTAKKATRKKSTTRKAVPPKKASPAKATAATKVTPANRPSPPPTTKAGWPPTTTARTPARPTSRNGHRAPHVPANYKTTFSWFVHGLTRQPLGAFIALLAGYSALVVALWYAVFGLILGVLVALGAIHKNSTTQALFHAGAGTSVTAVAVVAGGLVGAGGAFTSFYTDTLFADPYRLIGSLVSGALFAVVIVGVIAVFEGHILALRGCRQLAPDEVKRISPLLQQMGTNLGLRDAPRFAIRDVAFPNAWTHMRHIVLTTGLLDTLDDNELAAVIGHELHHWRVGDSVGQHFVWACAWPIALLYNVAYRVSHPSPQGETQLEVPPRSTHGFVTFIAWAIAWPAWFLLKFPITLAVRREMREQEYEADAAVRKINHGSALISALKKLSIFEGGRTGWDAALAATHPPTKLRIARLSPTRDADADYVEPPLGSESDAFVGFLGALVIIFAILIAWGAILNSNRNTASSAKHPPYLQAHPQSPQSPSAKPTPVLSQQQQQAAEHTAASFTTAFIDTAFNQAGYDQVISQYAAPDVQATLDSQAGGAGSALYGIDPSRVTSRAQAIACGLNAGATANSATIGVFVRWSSGIDGITSDQWLTDNIALSRANGKWTPTNLPDLVGVAGVFGSRPDLYQDSTAPAGDTACP